MHITVTIKDQFGNAAIHPVCDTAKKFAALVGRKTLTKRDIDGIKGLGYKILVESKTVTL